jgi:long-chain acyl-CoA synthetase
MQARPTVLTGVPRVFEKLREKIEATGHEHPGIRKAIYDWSVGVANRRGEYLPGGQQLAGVLKLQAALADRLVFHKVRERLGGRVRFAVSGGAPLRPEIARFFFGAGIPLLEGYGLTETSPVISVMPLEHVRLGTVGPPLPNVKVRIAEDGEILVQGPSVMSGYYHRDADSAAVLRDGWFHTGDIGAVDDAGYLRITDRKKELLVTSGGKKIAPQAIENALKAQPMIEEALLIADKRNFVSALVVPDLAALGREGICGTCGGADANRGRDRRGERAPRALRTDQKICRVACGVQSGVGRTHANAEGKAPIRRGQVPRRDRRALPVARAGHARPLHLIFQQPWARDRW